MSQQQLLEATEKAVSRTTLQHCFASCYTCTIIVLFKYCKWLSLGHTIYAFVHLGDWGVLIIFNSFFQTRDRRRTTAPCAFYRWRGQRSTAKDGKERSSLPPRLLENKEPCFDEVKARVSLWTPRTWNILCFTAFQIPFHHLRRISWEQR